ncbi:MAG: formate dehydrogenase accessory protein FdhE [Syntrophales bacterium]|nr:formate dehydrogenase accessory protein FdhE [Syntrophales bacterium]
MLKDALKTIEHYKSTNPIYEELLDILGEILILREEYQRKMKDTIFRVDENLIEKKMVGGLPLIDFSAGNFDLTEPKQYFLKLLEIAEKRVPGETKEIARMVESGNLDFERIIRHSFSTLDGTAGELDGRLDDDSLDLVELFAEESLRPQLEMVAEKYGEIINRSGWSQGYCPICGKEPKIGEIKEEEEGWRYLFCHRCGFEWCFTSIKCPFCGNEEYLAYFTVEGDERYRLDVCNICKRYIKMVDFRDTRTKVNLDVEDIATLHLDMLAYDEGYD